MCSRAIAAKYTANPRAKNPNCSTFQTRLAAAVVGHGLVALGRILQFFIMFIILLYDFIYALPEFCSVVSHEIGRLQRLGFFMQLSVVLRIGISGDSLLLTSR